MLTRITGRYLVRLDPQDADLLARKWHTLNGRYAVATSRCEGRPTHVLMHRAIAERMFGPIPEGMYVDHINRRVRDNRRCNLRLATNAQQQCNTRHRPSRCGYRGVTYDGRKSKYRARVVIEGVRRTLGRFATAEEAARVWDSAAVEVYGPFARLNFPRDQRMEAVA